MTGEEKLYEELRKLMQTMIPFLFPGPYLLSEMLADVWDTIEPKARIGIWFKRSVVAGQFSGIEPRGKTNRNHQIYYVYS